LKLQRQEENCNSKLLSADEPQSHPLSGSQLEVVFCQNVVHELQWYQNQVKELERERGILYDMIKLLREK
jgi:hypothetical protein